MDGPASGTVARVLVGPPGSGKTTALCKWLAQWVLVEGRSVGVFRLDGATANTGEFLSVYAEVLGVPVQRSLDPEGRSATEVVLIDLPGVPHLDRGSLLALRDQVQSFRPAQVHLVLNAAYDASLLMAQARAFACLNPTDWMATHLDEEPRWGKLWNVVMGTNCPLAWLGVGQNIPGMFHRADPDRVLRQQFQLQIPVDQW
jgi:flagellar biosynthesis protein FlhF